MFLKRQDLFFRLIPRSRCAFILYSVAAALTAMVSPNFFTKNIDNPSSVLRPLNCIRSSPFGYKKIARPIFGKWERMKLMKRINKNQNRIFLNASHKCETSSHHIRDLRSPPFEAQNSLSASQSTCANLMSSRTLIDSANLLNRTEKRWLASQLRTIEERERKKIVN